MRAFTSTNLTIAVLGWTFAVAPAIAQNTTAAVPPHTAEPAPVQITPFVSIDFKRIVADRCGLQLSAELEFQDRNRSRLPSWRGQRERAQLEREPAV